MRILDPHSDIEAFWSRVGSAQQRALLLDYDGTLAPFRTERDLATPYEGVREALETIGATGRTRMVIVSGRQAHEVRSLLGLRSSTTAEIWGTHGWERLWPDGRYEIGEMPAATTAGLSAAEAWVEAHDLADRLERKPAALAFHVRGLPGDEAARLLERVRGAWAALAERSGLGLHSFDGGVELRALGRDKGYAVQSILSGLEADAAVAYLGDDLTDEDAFVRLCGRGLSVLVRPQFRPTAAMLWLRPPEELIEFLHRWATVAGGA